MKWLEYLLGAIAEGLGFARKRQELVNTPEQQANAAAGTDAEIKASATDAVAKDDLAEIRKQAGE